MVDLTEAQVRKELAEEEESRVAEGGVVLHETSAASFLVIALNLEDSQYVANPACLR